MGHKGTPLRPQDAYKIAVESWEMEHLEQAASWLETALNNTPKAEMSITKVKDASYAIADAMAKLGVFKYGVSELSLIFFSVLFVSLIVNFEFIIFSCSWQMN